MGNYKKYELSMLLCAILWSTSGLVLKFIHCNSFLIAGGRGIFTCLVLGIYFFMSGYKFKITKYCLFSALASFINVELFMAANKFTTAANSIVLQYTAPIFVLIFTGLILKERLKKYEIFTVVVALGGISLFFFDQLDTNGFLGNCMAVASGFFMAIMFVMNGKIQNVGERMTGMLIGFLLVSVVGIPIGMVVTETQSISTTEILLIIYLGVVQMGITYIIYAKAASVLKPVSCSLISMIEPMLNPIWVACFYGEMPGIFAMIGAAIIIGAVVVYTILDGRLEHDMEREPNMESEENLVREEDCL